MSLPSAMQVRENAMQQLGHNAKVNEFAHEFVRRRNAEQPRNKQCSLEPEFLATAPSGGAGGGGGSNGAKGKKKKGARVDATAFFSFNSGLGSRDLESISYD
eukprot:TRINITY_DN875_c0_g2_i1.p3 TRINITY_DN875_c0_g2~~TRINITY_DN875_c0_g2_i1.p3  ORF type:complete len:102 (-),score=27.75 TRINITY_DN875_c0_g2_i1:46-351(-)